MAARVADRVALYGTEELPAAIRHLAAGSIQFDLEAGKIRYVRVCGVEVLRCIAFVVRGPGWETLSPEIFDLDISEDATQTRIDYRAIYSGPGGRLQVTAAITAQSSGLRFSAEAEALTDFTTARTSFCILHPIAKVAGGPLRVTRVDESIEETIFPDIVSARQPFLGIRALSHPVAEGLWATVRMEGDVWEMEDQRNWTDASFKTYGRPLDLPWPYTLSKGTRVAQSVALTFAGALPRISAVAADEVEIAVDNRESGRLPDVALALPRGEAVAAATIAQRLAVTPRQLVCWFEVGSDGLPELQSYKAVSHHLDAPIALELILPCKSSIDDEVAAAARLLATAGIVPAAVTPIQAAMTKWVRTVPEEMGLPGYSAVYAGVRRAFPGVPIGAGVVSNFTELNIQRPSLAGADYVTHCTAGVIHEPDDRSVMETLETLPHIFRSVRHLAGDLPYRIGPSAIGMRYNPYGKSTESNHANVRIAFAHQDPRQRGLFGAAFALGYFARSAAAGVGMVCLGALCGPFGLAYRRMPYGQPWFDEAGDGAVYPLYHVVAPIAAARDSSVLGTTSSDPKRALALAYRRPDGELELWIANLTAQPQHVRIAGRPFRGSIVKLLDAATFAQATSDAAGFAAAAGSPLTSDRLDLSPYAVARIRAATT